MDINTIISQMTLEEKASLCSGESFWETKAVERLGIPSIMMTDGPHGLRKQAGETDHLGIAESVPATCFPAACATACSFDRELIEEMGRALGEECVAEDVQIILGPGTNIKRSPLCGRNFEYFSEDPLLSSEMSKHHIMGVQSKGIGTSLKHFAANSQETRRFSSDSIVDERTLHEIYLGAFEGAVRDARPATIMCSYNRVNGTYACENPWLLTEVLREKWGFQGFVVSDWGAVNDRVDCLKAGLELEMPASGGVRDAQIVEAVKSGALDEAVLDEAVRRILSVIERTNGHTEHPPYDGDAHHALARKIAGESIVLLKNDGLLPLKPGAKVSVIGEFAVRPRYQGAGSSQVNPTEMTSPLEAIKEYGDAVYAQGYKIDDCEAPDAELEAEALKAARSADVCILVAGLPPAYESEGYDREHMRMPRGQNELICKVARANPNTIVVLQNGSPVEMPWINEVGALLEAYLGGQAGGGGIADVIFGKQNPCGKLAETFPLRLQDNPSYLSYIGERDRVQYSEGVFVGYRYYDSREMDVLFPFGFGLSYTDFEYSNLSLSSPKIDGNQSLKVTLDIKNTGTRAGKEIVQLYVSKLDRDDQIIRPVHELRDFGKVFLEAGETKTVSFTIDKRAFSYYETAIHDFCVMSGEYEIQIGKSSRDIVLRKSVIVKSGKAIKHRADINTPFRDIMLMPGGKEFIAGILQPMAENNPAISGGEAEPGSLENMFARMIPEMSMRTVAMFTGNAGSLDQAQALLDAKLNN